MQELIKSLEELLPKLKDAEVRLQAADEYKRKRSSLEKALAAKQAELDELTKTFDARRSEYAVWKRGAAEHKERAIEQNRVILDKAKEDFQAEYDKLASDFAAEKKALTDSVAKLHSEEERLLKQIASAEAAKKRAREKLE